MFNIILSRYSYYIHIWNILSSASAFAVFSCNVGIVPSTKTGDSASRWHVINTNMILTSYFEKGVGTCLISPTAIPAPLWQGKALTVVWKPENFIGSAFFSSRKVRRYRGEISNSTLSVHLQFFYFARKSMKKNAFTPYIYRIFIFAACFLHTKVDG